MSAHTPGSGAGDPGGESPQDPQAVPILESDPVRQFRQKVVTALHDTVGQSLLLAGYLLEDDPVPVARVAEHLADAQQQLAEVMALLRGDQR